MATAGESRRPLRVLIVASDGLTRLGLATLLATDTRIEIVGQVSNSDDIASMSDVFQPEAIVWEVGWEDSAQAIEQIVELPAGAPPILAVRSHTGVDRDLWTAGVRGVVGRDALALQLIAALDAIDQGLVVALPGGLPQEPRIAGAATHQPIESLTARELDVLHLLAEGLANKEIARRLALSEHTVKFHVNAILGKLGAVSRTDAVVRATRAGILLL